MSLIRAAIDGAVAAVMAEHPKYFTDKGHEHARLLIVRKIMAALRGDGDKSESVEDVTPAPSGPIAAEPTSRAAIAYLALRHAAGAAAPFRMSDGKISIPREAQGEDAMAFADAPTLSAWPLISDRQQIGAWTEFFREVLKGVPRKPITITEGGQIGIRVPWLWPPSKTGKVYDPSEAA